jgi:hypothetical protein
MMSVNDEVPTAEQVAVMTDQQRKVLENRLRRAASRQGLALQKSRLRDPRAIGYGTYMLTDQDNGNVVAQGSRRGYGLHLEDVAQYLYGDREIQHDGW